MLVINRKKSSSPSAVLFSRRRRCSWQPQLPTGPIFLPHLQEQQSQHRPGWTEPLPSPPMHIGLIQFCLNCRIKLSGWRFWRNKDGTYPAPARIDEVAGLSQESIKINEFKFSIFSCSSEKTSQSRCSY